MMWWVLQSEDQENTEIWKPLDNSQKKYLHNVPIYFYIIAKHPSPYIQKRVGNVFEASDSQKLWRISYVV